MSSVNSDCLLFSIYYSCIFRKKNFPLTIKVTMKENHSQNFLLTVSAADFDAVSGQKLPASISKEMPII